jgi:hypothetical protein
MYHLHSFYYEEEGTKASLPKIIIPIGRLIDHAAL